MKLFFLSLLVPLSIVFAGVAPADIYKYSDQEGRTKSQSLSTVLLTSFASGILKVVPVYPIIVLPLLLVGFAQYCYPNISYNLGGGQPNIAELQIGIDKPVSIKLPDIGVSRTSAQGEDTMITDPVVIWYQSDKFLYLAPLATHDQGPTRLVALDITLVRTIRYLFTSIRVAPGGRILSVHSD